MLGLWKASGFPTDHPQDGKLESAGWYGKRFTDTNSVDPMIFYANDGEVFSADPVYVTRNLSTMKRASDVRNEIETKEPKARLRMVEARSRSTASMVYNDLPIIDHFHDHVHLKIQDDASQVHQIPDSVVYRPDGSSGNSEQAAIDFGCVVEPFSFAITGRSNGDVLSNTSGSNIA
ncbi:hypothetical protein LTR03_006546 [Friedmanniomyces endolithicus]|nr:hypothetical protein LTR03_006546 [Friedmanniomyces endolithicus]